MIEGEGGGQGPLSQLSLDFKYQNKKQFLRKKNII